ncbi:tetratricopeptide repeat protein [Chitinophaga eiseniae]|nr:hypothetical protein [Chitinophaga eiseniae]
MLSSFRLSAQDQEPVERKADVSFQRQEYARAAALYENLLHTHYGKRHAAMLHQRLATSYRGFNQYGKAAYWYEQVLKDSSAVPADRLNYADMLKSLGKFAEAREQYLQYPDQQRVAMRIHGCDSAVLWQSLPVRATIVNVKGINSSSNDWGAVKYGRQLVFVSDSMRGDMWFVKGSRRRYYRTNTGFGKIYTAEDLPSGTGYVKDFSPRINNFPYHTGPLCFSANGDTAYVTVTDPQRRISFNKKEAPVYGVRHHDLVLFIKQRGQWQGPIPFPYNSQEYSTEHAVLNSAGNILYFTSDRPGGIGATDIWYCEKNVDNSWGTPQNCGSSINTADEEAFTVTAPGDRLFFASKGWPGMGGYDVFCTEGSKNHWSAPMNMHLPFNSPGDDFYYFEDGDGKGFFSSNREGGAGGDDIYSFSFPPAAPVIPVLAPLLRIPLQVDICTTSSLCVYLFNKTRGVGWCYVILPPYGEIEAKLEPDANYVLRLHYANRVDSVEFSTKDGVDSVYKKICR